jgi:hypothetical protein
MPWTPEDNQLDAMIAAASEAYDKRLREIAKAAAANDMSKTEVNELMGQECDQMMQESLPPLDTPNTTEDGQPRAMTISSMPL